MLVARSDSLGRGRWIDGGAEPFPGSRYEEACPDEDEDSRVALYRSGGEGSVPLKASTAGARGRHEVVELVGPCLRGPGSLLHQWLHRLHEAVVEERVPGRLGLPDIEDPEHTGLLVESGSVDEATRWRIVSRAE